MAEGIIRSAGCSDKSANQKDVAGHDVLIGLERSVLRNVSLSVELRRLQHAKNLPTLPFGDDRLEPSITRCQFRAPEDLCFEAFDVDRL